MMLGISVLSKSGRSQGRLKSRTLRGTPKVCEIANLRLVEGVESHAASPMSAPEFGGVFAGVTGMLQVRVATVAQAAWSFSPEGGEFNR
jgi:hypothetical protein